MALGSTRSSLHRLLAGDSSLQSQGGLSLVFKRWATKKAGGSTQNNRDSQPKYLGVKKFGGERVIPGNIIVRQRGTTFHPGDFVGMGRDHTLWALIEGNVKFEKNPRSKRQWVHVIPKYGAPLHPLYRDMKPLKAEEPASVMEAAPES